MRSFAFRPRSSGALTAKEKRFVTSRGGFIALEMILDTVRSGSPVEIEEYLNSE